MVMLWFLPTKDFPLSTRLTHKKILFQGSIGDDNILFLSTKSSQINGIPKNPSSNPHRSLGHPSLPYLNAMFPEKNFEDFFCPDCMMSKMHKKLFGGSFPKPSAPLEIIHMDLCGLISPMSMGGCRYFLKIIDGFSRYRFLYPLKRKEKALKTLSEFLPLAEKVAKSILSNLVTNNGGKFVNCNFSTLLKKEGIQHLTTAPYSPQ